MDNRRAPAPNEPGRYPFDARPSYMPPEPRRSQPLPPPLPLPPPPPTAQELSNRAQQYNFSFQVSFSSWLRAADALCRQGTTYAKERDYAQAYELLFRYSCLIVHHLPKHPGAKTVEGRRELRKLRDASDPILDQLGMLKSRVDAAHDEWVKVHEIEARERRAGYNSSGDGSAYSRHEDREAELLEAGRHQDLAVDLAKEEIYRRDAARRATRQAGISVEEEQQRRGGGLWNSWRKDGDDRVDDDTQRQMQAARRRLERPSDDYDDRPITSNYQYPTISKPSRYTDPDDRGRERSSYPDDVRPSRPPKESYAQIDNYSRPQNASERPPRVPKKEVFYDDRDSRSSSAPLAPSSRPSLNKRVTFRPEAWLESGMPLRTIFLPASLRPGFLKLAEKNTRAGLEMCGVLCGTAVNNALFISTLLIPQQTCTSDTCETTDEAAIMDYCMTEDLMVFGWIHTHPTQTCFMSSRDLHTQSGYQVMMAESISIVCAPSMPKGQDFGIFRLTDPPGLPHVLNCTQPGTFHQHTIDNLYTEASKPAGHVLESRSLPFKVADLRQGS